MRYRQSVHASLLVCSCDVQVGPGRHLHRPAHRGGCSGHLARSGAAYSVCHHTGLRLVAFQKLPAAQLSVVAVCCVCVCVCVFDGTECLLCVYKFCFHQKPLAFMHNTTAAARLHIAHMRARGAATRIRARVRARTRTYEYALCACACARTYVRTYVLNLRTLRTYVRYVITRTM